MDSTNPTPSSDAFPSWDFGSKKETEAPQNPPQSEGETTPSLEYPLPKKEASGIESVTEMPRPLQTSTSKILDLDLWWKTLMATVAEKKVTDIIFHPELCDCCIRVNTEVVLYQRIGPEHYKDIIYKMIPDDKKVEFEEKGESDFAVTCFERRMRVNVFKTLKGISGAFRPLPNKSIPWKDNGLTDAMMHVISNTKQGLVLVTGPTGSGKSTTICSMLEYLNEKYPYHIISIEDPIEYIFHNKRSVISQREVGEHTLSFQSALRASLRENPDIIFVGEMRDYETSRTALMAADTGHLVFGTLHTRRVYTTISRLLEMAPESSRAEMRAMLSNALAMVVCQRLLQKKGGGIWPCREVMMLNPAISSLIKEGKEKGISNQLTINQKHGMVEWGKALELAERSGLITAEEAEKYRDSTEDVD